MALVTKRMEKTFTGYKFRVSMVLGCLVVSLLFLLFQGGKLALAVSGIVITLNVYLFLGRWSGISQAVGQRVLYGGTSDMELAAGSALHVKLKLHVPGFWPIPYVMVRDRLVRKNGGVFEYEASFALDWIRRGELDYYTQPLTRGFYHFERTDCSTEDIFGIFEHKSALELPMTFTVLPQTVLIREWSQLHRMLKGAHYHSVTTKANRETTQINGVREYSYGDRLSRIHWNATARTGNLKSKEFERESLPRTLVVLDRQQRMYASTEQFELAVSTSASLLEYGKNREISLGMLSVGSDSVYFEPKGYKHGIRPMMRHLIGVAADGTKPLLQLLEDRGRQLVSGSCVIIVSPQKGEAVLKALAWIHMRQMVPCHILLTNKPEDGRQWCKQLQSMGYMGYAISNLEDLPVVLGGASNG